LGTLLRGSVRLESSGLGGGKSELIRHDDHSVQPI
jgi:hypothetical protein